MDTYTILRHFADSWGLLAMALCFGAVVLYVLRPGAKPLHDEAAGIPLRNDDMPGE